MLKIIAELLNKGIKNAIPGRILEKATGLETRTLYAQIERERREGQPIIASKGTRETERGFYLPENDGEKEAYINKKKNEVITCLETIQSIKYGKTTTLDDRTKAIIQSL